MNHEERLLSPGVTPRGPSPEERLFVDPQTHTEEVSFPDPARIRIYDTTLRDGEQTPGVAFSPEQKYALARMLSEVGVHIIDVGFPSVSASERQILQRIVQAKREGLIRKDLEILVMCRANRKDVDVILRTLEDVGAAPHEITMLTFTAASDLHIKVKLCTTLLRREGASPKGKDMAWYREANIRMMEDICSYIRSQGIQQIELGTEDASRCNVDYLVELIRRSVAAGATRYIFPDTTGSLTPEATRFYVRRLRETFPELPMVSHFHNDFDLATVNTIIALQEGMEGFSVTVNGIGERAGNAALHSIVVSLKVLYGVVIPGFRYDLLKPVSELVEAFSGIPVSPNEPVVGRNVFAHESGLHAHGVLRDARTYEPIRHDLLIKHGLDEDRARVSPDVSVSGRGDEEGLYLVLKAAGYEQRVAHDAVVVHDNEHSHRTFFRYAFKSGGAAARLGYKYYLPPRIELAPLLLAYLLWPLMRLGRLGWLPSTLAAGFFLAAILYNDLFRKKKTVLKTLITFPLLVVYYHARLLGYLVQFARLWMGLEKTERVRLKNIR